MRKFDYSFLERDELPEKLISLTSEIAALNAIADKRKEEHPEIFTGLESMARIRSVKCSNALEDITASDERIAAIVSGRSTPLNGDEAEIAGYCDALNEININSRSGALDFRESDIQRLHAKMLSHTGYGFGGKYKTSDNVIVSFDSDGNQHIIFRPISASETEKAMEQLLLAYADAAESANINSLMLIPCVIFDLMCVHPFRDGNGRLTRLLTLLLMYKNGYDIGRCISFEEQIYNHKTYYHESMRQSAVGWAENENSYFPVTENFLTMLCMCYKELDRRFS